MDCGTKALAPSSEGANAIFKYARLRWDSGEGHYEYQIEFSAHRTQAQSARFLGYVVALGGISGLRESST